MVVESCGSRKITIKRDDDVMLFRPSTGMVTTNFRITEPDGRHIVDLRFTRETALRMIAEIKATLEMN